MDDEGGEFNSIMSEVDLMRAQGSIWAIKKKEANRKILILLPLIEISLKKANRKISILWPLIEIKAWVREVLIGKIMKEGHTLWAHLLINHGSGIWSMEELNLWKQNPYFNGVFNFFK